MAKQRSNSSDLGIGGGGAGKGDAPRHNFSQKFRDNYDSIDWGHKKLALVAGKVPKDFSGTVNDLVAQMIEGSSVKEWTKANDDALHAFCDHIETFGTFEKCNTSSPKTS